MELDCLVIDSAAARSCLLSRFVGLQGHSFQREGGGASNGSVVELDGLVIDLEAVRSCLLSRFVGLQGP